MTETDFTQAILEAVERRDGAAFKNIVGGYASFCGKNDQSEEPFPDATFGFLTEILTQDRVLELEGAHMLFSLFQFEWSRLTSWQRTQLLAVLSNAYRKTMTSRSRFEICELLGEYYANSEAFTVLKHFGSIEPEECRVFVPHALEHLIRTTEDLKIHTEAIEYLRILLQDKSERVRAEAEYAVKRIKNGPSH